MSMQTFENPKGHGHDWMAIHEEDEATIRLVNPNNQLRGILHIDVQPPVIEGPMREFITKETATMLASLALAENQGLSAVL